ncbi:MAG TPA: VgrG-related protein [Kineosporiaceae bacterium]|nr:VgrG-related protein [Kineosporiaceae bacterium]
MADRRGLDTPVVQVDGRPLPGELYPRLRRLRVEESVHLPDRFTLRFEDADFALFDRATFTLGTRVQIAFRTESDPVVVTEGEVTAIAVEQGGAGHHELVVTGLDLAHRLTRTARTRTFTNMSDAAIARAVAGEYRLDADVRWQGDRHAYVMQAGRTDWAFLKERAARTGHDVWVTGTTLHVAPTPTAPGSPRTATWGKNLLRFSARFTAADRCDEVVVHGWDGVGGQGVRGGAGDQDPGSDAPAVQQLADAARTAFGRQKRETGRRGVATGAEADGLATSLLSRSSSAGVVLRGEVVGDPLLGAGSTLRLEGVGQGMSGDYRLTGVEHVYGADGPYLTRFVAGMKDPATLVDLLGSTGGPADPPPLGSVLLVGEVTNTHDGQERLARVRVRFPTLSGQDESQWARLAVPGGGASRGIQWLPEQGDEVLVGFEFGDVHRPVVLGGLWSRQAAPPEPEADQQGKTKTRVLASRKNSRLELVDDPKTRIVLRLGDAASALTLTADESSLTGERTLTISADKLVLTGKQKLEISSDGDVVVSGRKIRLN